jgi:hypothetical protein
VGLGPIAGDDFNTNPGTVMAHAGNLGVALLQLLLTRLPLVSTHFQVWPCVGRCSAEEAYRTVTVLGCGPDARCPAAWRVSHQA